MNAVLITCFALASSFVVENATVHTGDGRTLTDAKVLVRGKRIVRVGEFRNPPGAARIDATGQQLTPGFVEARSLAGIQEVGAVKPSNDHAMEGAITPGFRTADGFNPNSVWIPILRQQGITAVVARPSGGLISGTGAWAWLDGKHATPAAAGIWANFGEDGADAAGGSRGAAMVRLRQAFRDAKTLRRAPKAHLARRLRPLSLSTVHLDALNAVLSKKQPLVVHADRASDILRALSFAKRERVRVVIHGAAEAWTIAPALRDTPVMVHGGNHLPRRFESVAAVPNLAARLHAADVPLVISRGNWLTGRLRQDAGYAVRAGLPHAAALRAISATPASVFGHKNTGIIAAGQRADLVLWSGDPFETRTVATRVWIGGAEQNTATRQDLLARRYNATR